MRAIIILVMFMFSLQAAENLAKYDISMKMLGEIGHTTLTMQSKDEHYQIVMHLQMDKSLSDVEHRYESVGTIVDGVYRPEHFSKYIREDDREETNYYIFDYEQRQIQKYTTVVEDKSILFSLFSSDEKVITESFELIAGADFTENDTLSTFLNAKELLAGRSEMAVTSVGFRKDERNIMLHKTEEAYALSIVDKEASDDYTIIVSIAPDGMVKQIFIREYTMLGTISVARN